MVAKRITNTLMLKPLHGYKENTSFNSDMVILAHLHKLKHIPIISNTLNYRAAALALTSHIAATVNSMPNTVIVLIRSS